MYSVPVRGKGKITLMNGNVMAINTKEMYYWTTGYEDLDEFLEMNKRITEHEDLEFMHCSDFIRYNISKNNIKYQQLMAVYNFHRLLRY